MLRANCVGFGGKTRTSFRENNEKKQLLHLRGLPRTRSSGLSRRFPLEMFFTQGSAESPRRLPPVPLHLFFFCARALVRKLLRIFAHICAQIFTRILRDYFACNICAQLFANLCATPNEKFTPASIEIFTGISVGSCSPELPQTHARKLPDKP